MFTHTHILISSSCLSFSRDSAVFPLREDSLPGAMLLRRPRKPAAFAGLGDRGRAPEWLLRRSNQGGASREGERQEPHRFARPGQGAAAAGLPQRQPAGRRLFRVQRVRQPNSAR